MSSAFRVAIALAALLLGSACPGPDDCTKPARCDGNVLVKCGRTPCPAGTICKVPSDTNIYAYCEAAPPETCTPGSAEPAPTCSGDLRRSCIRQGVVAYTRCGLDSLNQDNWTCRAGA